MGLGIETTSYRYGFLYETVQSFDIITANGDFVRATRNSNPDLFHTLPASRDTLGFLVAVELAIVPAKNFMRLTYLPYHSMKDFCRKFGEMAEADNPPSFLEGLVFSGGKGVIMTGEFDDAPRNGELVNPINRWYKPWFYRHVEKFLGQEESVEYIPVRHYFHRHTPSIFFQLRDLIPFAYKAWFRWLFGWLGAPKISLMKYSTTRNLRKRSLRNRVAQDIIIPLEKVEEGLRLIRNNFEIYPLWVCPVRIHDHGQWKGLIRNPHNLLPGKEHQLFVDLGVYGIPPAVAQGKWNGLKSTRALERFTRDTGGIQMLYADIFMTRSEFEQMYDHQMYRKVRRKYQADRAFPEIYDKVIPEKWLINIDEEVGALEQGTDPAVVSAIALQGDS